MIAEGVVGRIEAGTSRVVDASMQELGSATQALVQEHEERMGARGKNATLTYFRDRHNKPISAEELAVLHYVQSGGEGLPNDEELTPRLAAAEQALDVIAKTDMLLLLTGGRTIVRLPEGKERDVNLSSRHIRTDRDSKEGGVSAFGGAHLSLPGLRQVHTFNLIDSETLATPVEAVEAVDGLFSTKAKRDEIVADSSLYSGPYVPIIAGSMAVSRFAVNLGVRVPVSQQHIDTDYPQHDRSFFGLARSLAEADVKLGTAAIEEVRERKPKMLEAIQKQLKIGLDTQVEYLLDADEEDDTVDIVQWFEDDDVRLFHTREQLQGLRDKLATSYQDSATRSMNQRIAAVTKELLG